MKRIAICGSEEKYWTPEQRTKVVVRIRDCLMQWSVSPAINTMSDIILVSGGCPKGGVDIWAEIVADVLGIEKDIHAPGINQWESTFADFGDDPEHSSYRRLKGYKERNIEIAEMCDVLYCIDPKGRDWSGGRWTLNKAKELGKETHLVEIE